MADTIGSGLSAAEAAAKAAAGDFVAKQDNWVKRNSLPIIIGGCAGLLLGTFIEHFLKL